jgi:glycosyltransferase involved in cell wall biosynthesis
VRILVLTNEYPPHSIGGYALSCQSVREQFDIRGHSTLVLTSDACLPGVGADPDERDRGVRRDLHFWFRDLGRREPERPNPPLSDLLKYERRNQRTVKEVLLTWHPDVVSVWEMGAMSLSSLTLVEQAGLPMVLTVHDYWPEYAPEWDPWLRLVERRAWIRPFVAPLGLVTSAPELSHARVNVISQSLKEKLASASRWGFTDAEIIPFGIDLRMFPVVEREDRDWTWKILYVGRLDATKGLRTLALAMTQLPADAALEVVGTGDPALPAMMREIIGEDRVRFSSCPRSELAQKYRAADVLVFPSEWDEPFGLVPLEAMASGVAVVATGTGGSGGYLRDGENCLLFPPGDPDRLALALRRLASDSGLRGKITSGGALTAQRYSLESCADQIERMHMDAARISPDPTR